MFINFLVRTLTCIECSVITVFAFLSIGLVMMILLTVCVRDAILAPLTWCKLKLGKMNERT